MTLSGWTRVWIVASVIWWIAGGLWIAMNVHPDLVALPRPEVSPPTPLTQEWIDSNYGLPDYRADYQPYVVPGVVVAVGPFAFGLLAIVAGAATRWIWRGFSPKKDSPESL